MPYGVVSLPVVIGWDAEFVVDLQNCEREIHVCRMVWKAAVCLRRAACSRSGFSSLRGCGLRKGPFVRLSTRHLGGIWNHHLLEGSDHVPGYCRRLRSQSGKP